MADTFTVTLVRHFPTKGNQEKKYIGWTDEPIITGMKPKKLSQDMKQVVCSDLLRCKQTAEQLYGETLYTVNANFRECSFGDWEEKTYNELKEDVHYRDWINNPRQITPPNGESLEIMEARVLLAFYEVVEQLKFPTIVTHGGPIRFLLTKFANVEKSFWDWDVLHGCSFTLQWANKSDVLEGKQCMSFSVEHLMENERM
ncbi:histidine phosphatase family protein [Psychrobacillus vulpis]|uniref:Histidine phosphatase family protein n=1 Tax=Psychrobacillus vulpis TaxID=2325572 RepID=A0A544TUL8_9BACI|nr:histidine phosphatase family protein [Psychrobacillus vulpis]TQR21133.1 histidine phosphatase family protein [Psychrobacillus vulpis]